MRYFARSASITPMAGVAVLLLNLIGCSGGSDGLPREAVSGTVTLDGQPLAQGVIQLLPSSQKEGIAGGAIIKDGKFAIERNKGLVPGEYRVIINSSPTDGKAATPGEAPGTVETAVKPKDPIPAQYNEKTTLKAEVKAGTSNTFEFALKTK